MSKSKRMKKKEKSKEYQKKLLENIRRFFDIINPNSEKIVDYNQIGRRIKKCSRKCIMKINYNIDFLLVSGIEKFKYSIIFPTILSCLLKDFKIKSDIRLIFLLYINFQMLKLISFGIIKKISIRKLLSYDTKFKIRAKKPYSVTYKMYKPLYLIYSGYSRYTNIQIL